MSYLSIFECIECNNELSESRIGIASINGAECLITSCPKCKRVYSAETHSPVKYCKSKFYVLGEIVIDVPLFQDSPFMKLH